MFREKYLFRVLRRRGGKFAAFPTFPAAQSGIADGLAVEVYAF